MEHDVKRRKFEITRNLKIYPVLAEELIQRTPLIEVYTATVCNPKNISKCIIELNSIMPLPELTHLKRIKGKDILICPVSVGEKADVLELLKMRSFDISLLANDFKVSTVAKIAPIVRKQYDVANKLWPCNFYSNKYLEKLSTNTLFNEKDISKHEEYMSVAIEVAKFYNSSAGAVVVDPRIESIVAVACTDMQNPCRHAAMVAVDNVAKTQSGGAWKTYTLVDSKLLNLSGLPSDINDYIKILFSDLSFGATWFKEKDDLVEPTDGPYLCTGYYVYLTREPCIMCAMALVHSRVKRVFYGVKSASGGLGTLCKIHTVRDLNHHYEVFAGVLADKCSGLNTVDDSERNLL